MKITEFDFKYLKTIMLAEQGRIPAHIEFLNLPENKAKIKDFDTRLRWDWFNFAIRGRTNFLNKLYDYLNDEHIDTALKQIVKTVNLDIKEHPGWVGQRGGMIVAGQCPV